jgi:hypothetical protein
VNPYPPGNVLGPVPSTRIIRVAPVLTLLVARGLDDMADGSGVRAWWMFHVHRRDWLRYCQITIPEGIVAGVAKPWLGEVPEVVAFRMAAEIGFKWLYNDACDTVRRHHKGK